MSSKWFKTSVEKIKLYEYTKFLPNDAVLAERIYCLRNNLTSRPVCICGLDLFYISKEKRYTKSCKPCFSKVTTFKSTGNDLAKYTKTAIEYISKYLNDMNSESSSYEEVIKFIDSKKNKTNKLISTGDYMRNAKNLKQIINLTSYIPFDPDNMQFSKRMYNIYYNMHEGKLCAMCKVNKTTYRNFRIGYQSVCADRCMYLLAADNAKIKSSKIMKDAIASQGFELVGVNDIDRITNKKLQIKCNKCEGIFTRDLSDGNWKNMSCYVCHGEPNISKEEKGVLHFIKHHNPNISDILENKRIFNSSKHELDVYIPSLKFAIEYNGSRWHSFGTRYPNNLDKEPERKFNHINKTKMCSNIGIRLFQICSTEWLNTSKREIWKSILNKKLENHTILDSADMEIVELDSNETNMFLNANHLRGMDNSKVRLGLKHNDEIVSVMTFSKPRLNKNYQWELVRFCNILNTSVSGAEDKLFNYFINRHNPENILAYSDIRYSSGDSYSELGFKHIKNTTPSYVYVKGDRIMSRFSAQKHLQKNFLEVFDPNKTEVENMMENKYRRLWDCGNMLFTWNK